MMSLPRNKLIPVLGVGALALASFMGLKAIISSDAPVAAGSRLTSVPSANSAASGAGGGVFGLGQAPKADGDRPSETMATLAARLAENDKTNKALEGDNRALRADFERLKAQVNGGGAYSAPPVAVQPASTPAARSTPAEPAADPLERNINSVVDTFEGLTGRTNAASRTNAAGTAGSGMPPGLGFDGLPNALPGARTARNADVGGQSTTYTTVKPLGYEDRGDKNRNGGPRFVRVQAGTAGQDAQDLRTAALQAPDQDKKDEQPTPYFTIPENATLTRVVAMTAVVGRVPIDGKVQDPMQFKAIVGRENLAANGMYVPDDISGIVVSGTAVGDMTMSCSEGHIHSLTFVFNDGAIRTISTRKGSAGVSRDKALGYISDEYGNPCIGGRFVTNAPAYLTDVVGLKTLSTASKAYAAAQTSTTDNSLTGNTTSSVTGNRGAFVLGQAAASGVDEVSSWLFSRLKNSFDAVITPAGQRIVLHIDQEIAIDKAVNPRRLDHTRPAQTDGARHGLD
jgi:integrating conjugative element protein (TIGR03752 family)